MSVGMRDLVRGRKIRIDSPHDKLKSPHKVDCSAAAGPQFGSQKRVGEEHGHRQRTHAAGDG